MDHRMPSHSACAIKRWILPLAVALLTVVAFLPVLSGSFLNWDDDVNFRFNRAYRELGWEQIRWAFTSVVFGHYIPVTRLTFSLNYALGGMSPWGYHLFNLLAPGLTAALFYIVARRLLAAAVGAGRQEGRDDREVVTAAAAAALVFGLHPLRVEPVAWITGRADLLCATFVFLSTWAYLHAIEAAAPVRRKLLVVATAAFAAALLSKAAALPLPFVWLLLDVYPLRRVSQTGWLRLAREKIPTLAVAFVAVVLVAYATRHGAVMSSATDYGPLARITLAAYSFVIAAAKFVWPTGLSPLYEMPAHVTPLEPRFGLA